MLRTQGIEFWGLGAGSGGVENTKSTFWAQVFILPTALMENSYNAGHLSTSFPSHVFHLELDT